MDVVYLDFAKAFDKVDYGILLAKLRTIGISGQLLKWLCSFLTGRKQVVNIEGSLSSEGPVTSGVPQGSSLGPLLFLIHIADIDAEVDHVVVSSFADDTRLTLVANDIPSYQGMQQDLNKVYHWANVNNMSFNMDKFELIRYGPKNDDAPNYHSPNGVQIKEVNNVRDLGVEMEGTSSFSLHMGNAIKRSSNLSSWVLRVFKTRDQNVMMTLFNSLVVPHMEYCCQLWSPHLLGDIRRLEAVQRSSTARISGIGQLSYWERLQRLKLYSLERRRERYIIMYTFKIIQGFVPNFNDQRFSLKTQFTVRMDRICKIPAINTNSTAKIKNRVENSFAVQGPKLFNCLPPVLRIFQGFFQTFKLKLDKLFSKVPDKPWTPGY